MFKNFKKSFPTNLLIFSAIGAILIIVSIFEPLTLSFKDPVDIYDYSFDITEHGTGGHIETDLTYILDNCAYETTTHTNYGVETSSSTKYFYIIPVFDKSDNTYYIAVETHESESKKYEAQADYTWDYLEGADDEWLGEYIHISGTLKEMDDEIYGYMVDWFEEAEWFDSDADLKAHVLPIVLTPVNLSTTYILVFCILFIICLIVFVVTLIYLIRKRNQAKAAAFPAVQTQNGYSPYIGDNYSADSYNSYNDTYNTYNSPTSYTANQYVNINGINYTRSSLDVVNSQIIALDNENAINTLQNITGLDYNICSDVVNNWTQYYN